MTEQNAGAGSDSEIPNNSTGVDRPDVETREYADARQLAIVMAKRHWPEIKGWKPLETTTGIILQLENMFAGLSEQITRLEAELERGKAAERALHDMAAYKTRLEAEVQRMREAAPLVRIKKNLLEKLPSLLLDWHVPASPRAPKNPKPLASKLVREWMEKYWPEIIASQPPATPDIQGQP